MKKINKIFFSLSILCFSLTAESADSIREHEIEIPLATKCYPTKMIKDLLRPSEVILASEDTTKEKHVLVDYLIYAPKKNGIFMVRENTEMEYTCVISFFEKMENSKKKKKNVISN